MSPPRASIRQEFPGNIAAIGRVVADAFLRAPHADHTERFIVHALRGQGALFLSLVAEVDCIVVGHAGVSPVTVSDESVDWFGVGPVSVAPAHQRRGIGSQLLYETLRLLRERGAAGCVVLGDPVYYTRFGFRHLPGLLLAGFPPSYFQAIAFKDTPPQGIVQYHPAFAVTTD